MACERKLYDFEAVWLFKLKQLCESHVVVVLVGILVNAFKSLMFGIWDGMSSSRTLTTVRPQQSAVSEAHRTSPSCTPLSGSFMNVNMNVALLAADGLYVPVIEVTSDDTVINSATTFVADTKNIYRQ